MKTKKGTLFYPCCGTDVRWPLEHFSAVVSDCWFVERTGGFGRDRVTAKRRFGERVRFLTADARDAFREVEKICVFVFKCDHDVDGEGSSGLRWFEEPLLGQLLSKLTDEAFIVTDGSNCRLGTMGEYAYRGEISTQFRLPDSFSYGQHVFECVEHLKAVRGYGPVLLWKVSRTDGASEARAVK
jgi:hypothetical protein